MPDFSLARKKTRSVQLGSVKIGGFAPISVQSMTNTKTEDIEATVTQIHALERVFCDVVRVAVPSMEAIAAINKIVPRISIPLVADIHFDYKLAIGAALAGASGLRINPGNIGSRSKIKEIVACAKDKKIPIRIGINAGSLEKDLLLKHASATAQAMAESALRQLELLTELDFEDIKISLKASDVSRTIDAYRLLSEKTDFPLHVGITEAGSLLPGLVKSSVGIGSLLMDGIGDTIRFSLTGDPIPEVQAGFALLRSLGLRRIGPEIISCPTCGRCDIDLSSIVSEVEKSIQYFREPFHIAIMGCAVNGPGEAKEADIGIAGGKEFGALFRKGEIIRKVPQEKLVEELLNEIKKLQLST